MEGREVPPGDMEVPPNDPEGGTSDDDLSSSGDRESVAASSNSWKERAAETVLPCGLVGGARGLTQPLLPHAAQVYQADDLHSVGARLNQIEKRNQELSAELTRCRYLHQLLGAILLVVTVVLLFRQGGATAANSPDGRAGSYVTTDTLHTYQAAVSEIQSELRALEDKVRRHSGGGGSMGYEAWVAKQVGELERSYATKGAFQALQERVEGLRLSLDALSGQMGSYVRKDSLPDYSARAERDMEQMERALDALGSYRRPSLQGFERQALAIEGDIQKALDKAKAEISAIGGVVFVKHRSHDCPAGTAECTLLRWYNKEIRDPLCDAGIFALGSDIVADGGCQEDADLGWNSFLKGCCPTG